jgi:hypothetical protein
MIDYSIEVSFKFNDSNMINKESEMVRDELEKIALEHQGDMTAYDYDNLFDIKTGSIQIDCVNYNYEFLSFINANNFILNLPAHYEILWIHKNKSDYVIYSNKNKPDLNKFNLDDKNLYKTVLERIKNNK